MEVGQFREIFSRNLNALLDSVDAPLAGLGRTRFVADAFNVTTSSASKWLIGAAAPEPWKFEEIADFFRCSLDDLLRDKPKSALTQRVVAATTLEAKDSVFEALAAAVDEHQKFAEIVMVPPFPLDYPRADALYLLKIDSNAMEPYVVAGDLIVYRPVETVTHEGEYVLWSGRRPMVRRISLLAHAKRRGALQLIAENKRYPAEDLTHRDLHPTTGDWVSNDRITLLGVVEARILVHR